MGKLARLSARKVIQKLKKAGFEEVRQKGSYIFLENKETGLYVVVPDHGGKDIPVGTLHSIVTKQANLSVDAFNEL